MAGQVENAGDPELDSILRDPDLAELAAAYRAHLAPPYEERLKKLRLFALLVLESAVEAQNVVACALVWRELSHGRDPAETIARKIVRDVERAARARPPEPVPEPAPAQRSAPRSAARRPVPSSSRAAWRAATRLRRATVQSFEAEATARPAAAAKPLATPPRHPVVRNLSLRLAAGTSLATAPLRAGFPCGP